MIYFDNAATTFKKPHGLIKELNHFLKYSAGNPGRSSHRLSIAALEEVFKTRETISDFFNVDTPETVVYTENATHALNLAIKSIIKEGCHVVTSDIEHNAVIRPLETLKANGIISYDTFSCHGDIEDNLRSRLRPDTALIVSTLASNVTGKEIPIEILSRVALEYNIPLIVDASQLAGHKMIDLKRNPCYALCAPAHKALFGIQGLGFCVFSDNNTRQTLIEGGSGSDSTNRFMPSMLPEGYEAGTLQTPAIRTLRYGLEFIRKTGIDNVERKLNYLTDNALDRLSSLKDVKIYGNGVGIVSFNLNGIPSHVVSDILDKEGICTRAGLHCAPSVHRLLGTLDGGCVRVSFSYFNSVGEIDRLYKVLSKSFL